MKTINIMTSCDENLMKYIPVQLESITTNLPDKQINFYLFHDGKNIDNVNKLRELEYTNIKFHDVIVNDLEIYDNIAKRGGMWCGAAYYSLCAHKYLPDDMDRIYYIDAGDVMVIGNIDEYYFADFENKSLIATSIMYKVEDENLSTFKREDLFDRNYLAGIARGLFNSGSYVMNLNKIRKKKYTLKDYEQLAELIYNARGKLDRTYYGDQGFLSLIYIGDIKFYAYPKITNLLYMPYNFCLWYFDKSDEKLNYNPAIIHYVGDNIIKPWQGIYKKFLKLFQDKDKLQSFDKLKSNQIEFYNIWYKYAEMANKRLERQRL